MVEALDSDCAQKLKVLSDATRLKVLEILMSGPKHVGEINERLEIEQSLLSHHLKVLRDAGLVQATRDGKAVRYELMPGVASKHAIDLGCCQLSFPPSAAPAGVPGSEK
ncbi:MAG: putative transcriptional regulator [Armatimonadetes bacterium]|nr:putative transcriptional regulator [Armatimonadota bacterium]